MITVLLLASLQFDGQWSAHTIERSETAARLDEWSAVPALHLSPETEQPGHEVVGLTEPSDLSAAVRVARDGEALLFAVQWTDDASVAPYRSREDAVIVTRSGARRDAMYLTDNFKIQLWSGPRNYSAWFAPHARSSAPYQWHSLRVEGVDRTAETHRPRASIRSEARLRTLEISIPLEDLGITRQDVHTVRLMLVFTDADEAAPDRSEDTASTEVESPAAEPEPAYLAWLGELTLSPSRPRAIGPR